MRVYALAFVAIAAISTSAEGATVNEFLRDYAYASGGARGPLDDRIYDVYAGIKAAADYSKGHLNGPTLFCAPPWQGFNKYQLGRMLKRATALRPEIGNMPLSQGLLVSLIKTFPC